MIVWALFVLFFIPSPEPRSWLSNCLGNEWTLQWENSLDAHCLSAGVLSIDFLYTLGTGASWICGANSLCEHCLESIAPSDAKTNLTASTVSWASANWVALVPGVFLVEII